MFRNDKYAGVCCVDRQFIRRNDGITVTLFRKLNGKPLKKQNLSGNNVSASQKSDEAVPVTVFYPVLVMKHVFVGFAGTCLAGIFRKHFRDFGIGNVFR